MTGMHDHRHHEGRVTGAADRRLLGLSLALLLAFMVAEVVFGIVAESLALLADAGHMLTDAAALGLALLAASLATRPPGGSWTFGFGRVEILAAQANGITLLLFGAWIVYEAIRRLIDPLEVDAGIVGIVALVGILVNLAVVAAPLPGAEAEPERARRLPAHRHGPCSVRRHGAGRGRDPPHWLEPGRSGRFALRCRADVRRRLVAPA